MHGKWSLSFGLVLALVVAGCGLSPGGPPGAGPPVKPTTTAGPAEVYDTTYIRGAKVGHTVTRTENVRENGREVVRITSDTRITVRRFGDTTNQEILLTSVETPEGELLRCESVMKTGPTPIVVSCRPEAGKLKIEVSTQGNKQVVEQAWKENWGGFFAVEQSLRAQPMKPGEKRKVTQLFPAVNQVVEVELAAEDMETTKMLEGSAELLKIKNVVHLDKNQKLESWVWCDAAGESLKTEMPGFGQISYRTTKQQALADEEKATFDLGKSSVVKVKRLLDRPHETKRVVYRVHLPGGHPAEVFKEGVTQAIKSVDAETLDLVVRAVRPDDPPEVKTTADRPTDDDTKPNSYLQSDNPRVVKLSVREAAGETDPWVVAKALERMVHGSMKNKNFSQAFATAAEAAESLEGDCTEHAMLLAALCRARDIPARVATGLVYFAPQSGFAFHMWTEVWIKDRWVPLDATLGRGGIGAAHLKLAESNLKGADALSTFLPVAQVMGRLELEVLAVE